MGIQLRQLMLMEMPQNVYMNHDTADMGFVPLSGVSLEHFTDKAKAQFKELLDAEVTDICACGYGTLIEVGGVDPELLGRFDRAYMESRYCAQPLLNLDKGRRRVAGPFCNPDGGHVLEVEFCKPDVDELHTITLPCADELLETVRQRLGLAAWDEVEVAETEYGSGFHTFLEYVEEKEESIPALNDMCRAIQDSMGYGMKTLAAVLAYTNANGVAEVAAAARNLEFFDFYEGITDRKQLGEHIIETRYTEFTELHFFEQLTQYFNYDDFGRAYMEERQGDVTANGIVCYNGCPSLDEIMGRTGQTQGITGMGG